VKVDEEKSRYKANLVFGGTSREPVRFIWHHFLLPLFWKEIGRINICSPESRVRWKPMDRLILKIILETQCWNVCSKHCRNLPLSRLGVWNALISAASYAELGWYRDSTRPFMWASFFIVGSLCDRVPGSSGSRFRPFC